MLQTNVPGIGGASIQSPDFARTCSLPLLSCIKTVSTPKFVCGAKPKRAYAKPLARGQMVYYPASTAQDEAEARFGVAPHFA